MLKIMVHGKRKSLYDEDMTTKPKKPAAGAKNSVKPMRPTIDKHMRVSDILTLLPDAGPIVAQYGLHCFSCEANAYETLDEGCRTHGFSDADIDDLVTDLNELMQNRPERPQTITVTKDAALTLKNVLENEGKGDWGLSVGLDNGGGFCMEFVKDAADGDKIFGNDDVPQLKVFASVVTLGSIGGATIDFRDGRFKLDLPEDPTSPDGLRGAGQKLQKQSCGCKDNGKCGCQ